jgi:outer membrane lipoprotein carrier protein
MTAKKLVLISTVISFVLFTINITADVKPSARTIVEKVQKYYESINDYQTQFVQTTSHKLFKGRYQRAYGKVLFKKGGLMRWEYNRPEKKFFIYDGKTLWIYEPEVPQIFKGTTDAERLKKALAFLTGEGKITNSYNVKKAKAAKYGFSVGYVLILTPKEANSPFKHVELYVEKNTFKVIRSVVVDHEGNRNRMDFKNTKTGINFKPELFQFTPPPGVKVTQAR